MASQIGPLTAKIVANSEGMDPGLKQAEDKVKVGSKRMADTAAKEGAEAGKGFVTGFANSLRGLGAGGLGLASGLGQWAQQALTAPIAALSGGLSSLGDLATRAPILGPLLGLPFAGAAVGTGALAAFYLEGSNAIKEFAAEARQANVDLREFQVIATAIGDPGKASNALGNLQEKLHELAQAGGVAQGVLARVIPDAMDLQLMGVDRAFGIVSDRIVALGSRASQVTAIKAIFGKAGEPATEAILRGSAGLEWTRSLLTGFGADFGEGDLRNVKAAERAMKELGFLQRGIANQVTIALAPGVAELASRLPTLLDLGISGRGLADALVDGAERIMKAGAFVADTFDHLFTDPWGFLEETWDSVWDWAVSTWNEMLDSLTATAKWFIAALGEAIEAAIKRATDFIGRTFPSLFEGKGKLRKVGFGQMEVIPEAEGADRWGDNWGDNDPSNFSGGDWGPKRERSTNFMDQVENFMDRWRKRMNDLGDDARRNDPFAIWAESAEKRLSTLESPLEKLQKEWRGLKGFLDSAPNVFGIDDDEAGFRALQLGDRLAGRGGYQLLQQLRSLGGGPLGAQFVGAAERGSREAYSAVTQYQGAGRESVQEEVRRLLEEANEQGRQQIEQGRQAVEAMRDLRDLLDVEGI